MPDYGDKAKERFLRETKPPEVEGVKIDWSPLPHPSMRDLRGMRFGKLVVKAYAYTREQANGIPAVYWKCQCDCGNETEVFRAHLLHQGTKSCGCLSVVGKKGRDAVQKKMQKRSHYIKRMRHGLPPVPPTEVIGNPAHVFAYDSLMAYACLQWAGYEPAAHHHLIAKYLEKVEKGKIKRLIVQMPPRSGKACADSTQVKTTEGWKTHGELKVGDCVYGFYGTPTKVVSVSEKQTATMQVVFSHGEIIKCHENHEWGVFFSSKLENKQIYEIIETKELKKGLSLGIRYYLPESTACLYIGLVEIIDIKECEPESCNCIQVDSEDGLYLVGKYLIPTHNSMIISEYFPAWYLGRNPDKRVICASFGQELADDFGRKVRNQIADPMYGEIFPGVGLSGDSAAAAKFDLAPPHKGGYYAVGVGGGIVGKGASILLLDDLVKNREDADSETARRRVKDWYASAAYTRLMDNGPIVLVMQRWHVDDLVGWLLKEHKHERWTVLNLPAINDKGEALWPEKFPLDVLHQIKKTLPARDWEALYQQRPFVEEGGIFKRQWWKLWPDTKPLPECEFIIQSYDTAYSDKDLKSNSFSARTTWGVFKRADDECHNLILLEAWKSRVEYADLRKEATRAYQDYQPDKVIIEKKASGQALVSDLRRAGLPIATYTPTKDKITRAYIAQALFENGRVYYPSRQWAEDAITNLCQFPQGADDDLVDTVSMAFIWLQQSFLVSHSEDAKRRQQEDEMESDEDLPENVTRFRLKKKKRAVYG